MTTLRRMSELGYGDDSLKEEEKKNVLQATHDERKWWSAPGLRYPTSAQEGEAIRLKKLEKVSIPNDYFTSPSYIREDERQQYLRPSALNFLMETMQELDQRINFSKRGIRFSIISLYRSEDDQRKITEGNHWYRAVPVVESTHTAGASFDISLRSHYIVDPKTGEIGTTNTWDNTKIAGFDPEAIEALGALLAEKFMQGDCNLVIENSVGKMEENDYTPTCLHVCISPKYEESFVKENAEQ